jgi:hypothetical protein
VRFCVPLINLHDIGMFFVFRKFRLQINDVFNPEVKILDLCIYAILPFSISSVFCQSTLFGG